MTSRQRVLAALRHEETDRVPIDFGAMRSTGIMAVAYNQLKRYLRLEGGETRMYDVVQQLAWPEDQVLDRFGVDAIDLGRAWGDQPGDWKDWTLPDGSPAKVPHWFNPESDGAGGWLIRAADGAILGRQPSGAYYITQTYHPLAELKHERELDRRLEDSSKMVWAHLACDPWQSPLSAQHLADMRRRAEKLFRSTDRAIMGAFGGNMLESGQMLMGFGRFLMLLADDPSLVEALLDRLTETCLENLAKYLAAVGDYIQIIQMGDDLGTQNGPQLSPAMYRRLIKPRHKRVYSYVRQNYPHIFLFLHSCGSIYDLIPDLIEAGVQVLNPVQTAAAKMDPAALKREFGRDLAFWGGGCDTQHTLPHAAPEQVKAEVKQRIAIFSRGGGYVFNQVHNVQANVPPENVVAMFEAAQAGS
jgi:uroporphyrinogen decarboxylase